MIDNNGNRVCDGEFKARVGKFAGQWVGCRAPANSRGNAMTDRMTDLSKFVQQPSHCRVHFFSYK